jgi:hypothetical protein
MSVFLSSAYTHDVRTAFVLSFFLFQPSELGDGDTTGFWLFDGLADDTTLRT